MSTVVSVSWSFNLFLKQLFLLTQPTFVCGALYYYKCESFLIFYAIKCKVNITSR